MRECAFCGQLFEEENGHQKFCSEDCRHQQRVLHERIRRKKEQDSRGYRPKRSHLEWSDEDIQNRINTKSSKMIYCGGYVSSEDFIYLYCDDCGQPFKCSARGLRRQRPIQCDNCRHTLSLIREKEEREIALKNKEESRLLRKRLKEEEYIKSHTKICLRCGKEFLGSSKYCSAICRQRQGYSNKDHLRREIINNNLHDNISLQILAKRDNNKCWLCGKSVDWTDYTRKSNGVFVAGANYPSIDHVIPLSRGGVHRWNNVKLAHKICNTKKGDKLFGERKGKIIFFV